MFQHYASGGCMYNLPCRPVLMLCCCASAAQVVSYACFQCMPNCRSTLHSKDPLRWGVAAITKELCSILSHPSVAVQVFSMLLTGLSRVHGLGVFFVTIVLWA